MDLSILLAMAAEAYGDRIAVSTESQQMTYSTLLATAQRLAGFVSSGQYERVGYLAENAPNLPAALFTSALAGTAFAPINYRLADDRLRSVVSRLAPAVLIVDRENVPRLAGVEGVSVIVSDDFADVVAGAKSLEASRADSEQVAVWLFTSGTTGEPKVASLRHRHLASYVVSTVDFMSAGEDEAALVSVPPYHIAAMATILTNVYAGRRIVYLEQFDASRWVALAADQGVSHAMVVPTMLGRILDELEGTNRALPALRHLSYGGGRMPLPLIERAMAALPQVNFVNAYGLTETSSTIAMLGPDDHRAAFESNEGEARARLASVGRPLPSIEVEIRDADGARLPTSTPGEIFVRGDHVAGEYNSKSILDGEGWFATNDRGYLDAEGYLFLDGRLDDVIVRGGENLSPGEIEDVLLEHPAVAESGVAGIADTQWGEVAAAAVVLQSGQVCTQTELQEWVRTRLRSSRVPVVVDIRSELPYTPTGKLLRRELRVELAAIVAGG